MSNNILFIHKTQFGYHTGSYKQCEYLRNNFNITFLCFESGRKIINLENVKVKYISNKGTRVWRGIIFLLTAMKLIISFKGVIFILYFDHCEVLKSLFPKKKMILDIRTLSISPNKISRARYDCQLRKACSYFDHITVISEGVRSKLQLDENKSSILPLGADSISKSNKDFSELKLLYVGTLSGRHIEDTINGFSSFCTLHPEIDKITYDIVGDGYENELNELGDLVDSLGLSDTIKLHGRIPYDELQPFYEKCNVGVSYVPITEYYEYQPVTKTYEYILSGMVCVATGTFENKLVINTRNGIICKDEAKSFAEALETLFDNRGEYDSSIIRMTLSDNTWDKIVEKRLLPILKSNF